MADATAAAGSTAAFEATVVGAVEAPSRCYDYRDSANTFVGEKARAIQVEIRGGGVEVSQPIIVGGMNGGGVVEHQHGMPHMPIADPTNEDTLFVATTIHKMALAL